jgi:hypothetical protein
MYVLFLANRERERGKPTIVSQNMQTSLIPSEEKTDNELRLKYMHDTGVP